MDDLNLMHLEAEKSDLGLIDFSSENDSLVLDDDSLSHHHNLLSENWKHPQSIDLFESMNDDKEAETVESIDQIKQPSVPSDSSEPDRVSKKGNCNLRKSLAWNSAFFTSAGVLDPEELSGMIGGAEKSKNQTLPRIIEDVGGSTDSFSTLGSESLTTDNIEVELFEDIRASVQKSSKKLDAPEYKEVSKKSHVLPYGRKIGPTTQNQVKPKIAPKKPDVMSKAIPKQNLRARGPVKTAKQDPAFTEVRKSVKVIDSTTLTTKPPQITSNRRAISTLPLNRESFGATYGNKNENDKLKISSGVTKGGQDTKVASNIIARRTLPKPPLPLKSSSVSLSTLKTGSARSSTNRFESKTFDQKKVTEKQVKPSFGSTIKTPAKSAANNRTGTRSSALSYNLKSSKISGVSPASSISEWSSASSTSSSTINLKSNTLRTSFDSGSCQSLDDDVDHHPSDRTESNNQKTKISSTRPGPLAHPASAKLSGLRMPSPSIGFFDGVKSVQTPNGSAPQPHRKLSKEGGVVCGPTKHVNTKSKIGKHLNTRKPPRVIASEVILNDSDNGTTNGSKIDSDIIFTDTHDSNLENDVAKDGENYEKKASVLVEQQEEVNNV